MADCASEASEIAGKSAGVLLNLGIPNPDKLRAMRLAGETANLLHRPIVLDPVGAGASAYRREAIRGLLNRVQARIIRANAGEIQTLAGEESVSEGVDAVGTVHHTETLAKAVAERYECIAAVTGETDIITDGKRTVRILNGHPALSVLTGSGCMTLRAYSSVYERLGRCACRRSCRNRVYGNLRRAGGGTVGAPWELSCGAA